MFAEDAHGRGYCSYVQGICGEATDVIRGREGQNRKERGGATGEADSDAAASAAHRPVGRPLLVPPRGMPGDARVDREVKHIKGKNERDGRRGQRKGSATIHEPNVVRNFRTSEFAYARATSPGGGPLRLSAPIVLASSSIRRHQQSIHYRPERQ